MVFVIVDEENYVKFQISISKKYILKINIIKSHIKNIDNN